MKFFLKILFFVTVILLLIFAIYFYIISNGTIKPYLDKNGKILENSLSEKTIIEINGAKNGFFIQSKNIENPVLLFVSSGPGTDDYFFNEIYPDMNLSDFFTVCYWNYRGMGIVYDKNIDPNTITTSIILEDTKQITEYLKKRFNKEKIYIMGFSGGTNISLRAVNSNPENYYALFQMAQVVCANEDNDTAIYNFMKKVFSEKNDNNNLLKLEKEVIHLENEKVKCKSWPDFVYLLHKAGGGTIKDKDEFFGIVIPFFKSRCYTLQEKLNYVPGLKMYRKTQFYLENKSKDYRKDIKELKIPVYFISGDYDFNCPWTLVKEYCQIINAPEKEFLLVPNSAHSPLWENPKPVIEFMKSKIKN